MGIKDTLKRAAGKAADKVSQAAALSSAQVEDIEKEREKYLSHMPDPNDPAAVELTDRLLAANSVAIFNAYLPRIQDLYSPVERNAEYADQTFNTAHNVRYITLTKWVMDKEENSLEKLVNVYEVLSNEECNIGLIFNRTCEGTNVYLAVANLNNAADNVNANNYRQRLLEAIKGNFPGAEWKKESGEGVVPCLNNQKKYSVASATNIPTEKSEKFISQTIEKLLDGIVPETRDQEYTIILLATPVQDVEERKLLLGQMYSGLAPYASWSTGFTFDDSKSDNSMAVFGVNVGASAGVQNGQNYSVSNARGVTDSTQRTEASSDNQTETDSSNVSESDTEGKTVSDATGTNQSSSESRGTNSSYSTSNSKSSSEGTNESASGGFSIAPLGFGVNGSTSGGTSLSSGTSSSESSSFGNSKTETSSLGESATHSIAENVAKTVGTTTGKAIANSVGHSISNSLGQAVSNTLTKTQGLSKAVNLGANFGANFARSSTVTATVGKHETINQNYTNYTIKHTLEILEEQMKRYELSSALGLWDFAAYFVSEDQNVANNVAHSYLALTQGEKSHMTKAAVNLWRGDMESQTKYAHEICDYLRELRHPVFAMNPAVLDLDSTFCVYPGIITATTSLTGKELAYSLNFPRKSVTGFPVIECAEFGRNITTYEDERKSEGEINLGKIFHMNHTEETLVQISKNSLASHTFITGSTGSGKSNTVYQILNECMEQGVKFLVIEPAKGEYKNVFGRDPNISVYGTNPKVTPLLKINPFRFPENIHVLEHIDRLIEIFNVCWPMYAAMPAVLKNAVEQSYIDCGWDLNESSNPFGADLYPSFDDVARNIKTVIDSSEYDAENKGAYKGSLLTRVKSLTNGINGQVFTANEIPAEQLFDQNVIIDLSRVGSSETKSLLMGMLILKLQEYRMSSSDGMNSKLKHLTVLEEAHNILKRTSTEQPVDGGNLLGKSVEMISNAIAEMRTYGEGFIIADQAPGLLDMAAIRNTNTKIIMRLPDLTDRELVGKAANLNDDQIKELAKLPRGVAAVYQQEWIQPILCKVNYFPSGTENYTYSPAENIPINVDYEYGLKLAGLLSNGTEVDKEIVLTEISPKCRELGMDASTIVLMSKLLINPPAAPRMTKVAPIMNALFPTITDKVRDAYAETHDPAEWTKIAETELEAITNAPIEGQLWRDIIQGIITYYLLNELNNMDALRDWSQKGGLR